MPAKLGLALCSIIMAVLLLSYVAVRHVAVYHEWDGVVGGGDDDTEAVADATTDSTLLKQENMLVGPEFGNHITVRWGRPTSGLVGWWVGGVVGCWGGGLVGWWGGGVVGWWVGGLVLVGGMVLVSGMVGW